MPPLFASQKEYDEFLTRHNSKTPPEVDADTYTGKAYLGIDAGSTTTKLCLIAPDGGLLYTYYSSNQRQPCLPLFWSSSTPFMTSLATGSSLQAAPSPVTAKT